jgi:arginyl-tRNA synthetase
MKPALSQAIAAAVKTAYQLDIPVELTRPDEQFGDYATNVALQLAGKTGQKPRDIAEKLASALEVTDLIKEVSVAGPGFLNFRLQDAVLTAALGDEINQAYAKQAVVIEYSDPNPFKVLHAGHFYTSVVGDAIANLVAAAGGEVHRVNFGGDVGLHVAKTMWAILQTLGGEHPEKLAEIPATERSEWLAAAYVKGTAAYEDDEAAKPAIVTLNKQIYALQAAGDHDSPLAQIYWTCRTWSYDYFNAFYKRIGTTFEKYYPESETAPIGLKAVQEQLKKGVYKESQGAVVFDGEKYGLHTRVFINSEGLPTYEAKDVGLSLKKWEDYHFDSSIIITGNDITEYMKVVLKSIEQFAPDLAARTRHLTHGNVKLAGGVKMSSRRGNILRAVDVIEATKAANTQAGAGEDSLIGAIKYAFLKQRLGADIIYIPEESVSLEGNSGPYLQYAHARARSILAKAGAPATELTDLQPDERSLVRKMTEYSEAVDKAVVELLPHHVCTYLYELAQVFNRFYEHNRVIDDDRQAVRVALVQQYADILQAGLGLLGMAAPHTM